MSRARAIQFPDTPVAPERMNPELRDRLEFLRYLYRWLQDAEAVPGPRNAKAEAWIENWLLKGARESVEELGLLSGSSRKAAMKEFIASLDTSEPPVAALDAPNVETQIRKSAA
jgi:hypothetical protein